MYVEFNLDFCIAFFFMSDINMSDNETSNSNSSDNEQSSSDSECSEFIRLSAKKGKNLLMSKKT